MAEVQSKVLEIGAKILCILVLTLQTVLLDYIFTNLDTNASDAGRYFWIGLDALIVILWTISLIWSHRYFEKLTSPKRIPNDSGHLIVRVFKAAIIELPFAYVCWLLYSVVLVAKILRMFSSPSGFGEGLTKVDAKNILLTPTGIKIVLSMAGIVFGLLAYSHHNEVQNSKYKLIIEKLAHSASLDVLDCLMLISYLFIADSGMILPYRMDKTIKAFGCICILLPVIPLFALRYISNRQDEKTFQMVLALNSGLYLLFVNIPLFALRITLWIRHDADVTTFLTKNIMAIIRDSADIYLNVVGYWRDQKKSKPEQTDSALGSEERKVKVAMRVWSWIRWIHHQLMFDKEPTLESGKHISRQRKSRPNKVILYQPEKVNDFSIRLKVFLPGRRSIPVWLFKCWYLPWFALRLDIKFACSICQRSGSDITTSLDLENSIHV